MKGRPKKSVAQKKLQGTFRKDRHTEQEKTEEALTIICFEDGTELVTPKELTDTYVIDYFKVHTANLISFHLLSPQDIPELTLMYLTLQQLRQVYKRLKDVDITTNLEEYTQLTNASIRLGNRFSELCKKYYISPVSRAKLQLDAATLQEKKMELENKSATSKLLDRKTL